MGRIGSSQLPKVGGLLLQLNLTAQNLVNNRGHISQGGVLAKPGQVTLIRGGQWLARVISSISQG